MNRKSFMSLLGLLLMYCMVHGASSDPAEGSEERSRDRPNIILVYIDDLGYSDVGCYGGNFGQSFIETPHIDRLSEQGMKFTHAYAAAPLCSPSRAALLTGKTPARLGFEFVTKNPGESYSWDAPEWQKKYEDRKLVPPPFTLNLPLEEETVAEAMKRAGYTTAISGKWHVASHHQLYNGWNPEFGPLTQGFDQAFETFGSHPYSVNRGTQHGDMDDGEFPRDELTEKAIEYIRSPHNAPFFLFVSHYYVHSPLDTRMQWLVEKYRRKATTEHDKHRAEYAAFVQMMDHYVGQLVDALDSAKMDKNTIVVLTSDNGGNPQFAYNRPFRGSKWNLYEGGIRVPLIVRWPGKVKRASLCDAPVSQVDFLPTFTEIGGNVLSTSSGGIDGMSMFELFRGRGAKDFRSRTLVWHFPYYHPEGRKFADSPPLIGSEDGYISQTTPQSAILHDNYKAIYFFESDSLELYDLSKDPGEQRDISKDHPQKADMLKAELFTYLNRVKARLPRNKQHISGAPKQLTSGNKGHCLNNTQCFSPDDNWLVYDTRNDDTKIGSTGSIEMVNIHSGEIRILYQTSNQTEFGPGVGAATFNPVFNKVLFIHGIRNANARRPYGFTRRTGVAVETSQPGIPIFMDARDVVPPFTPGALRGGTHAHTWSGDGAWVSFTYNDAVIAALASSEHPEKSGAARDLRTVGVMCPAKQVVVADDADGENNSGSMFSVIIAEVTEDPKPGSDEISKAFDECWIGSNGYIAENGERQQRAIALQGHAVRSDGKTVTDIFVADLPADITKARQRHPLQGTGAKRPGVPAGVRIRRITRLDKGVSEVPRHWLRSTSDGTTIGFLQEDDKGHIQVFGVSPNGGEVKQLTFQPFSIQGPFNFSPDGRYVAYTADNSVFVSDIVSGEFRRLTERSVDKNKPVGAVNWSNAGGTLAWNAYVGEEERFLQVFLMQIK